MQHTQPEDCRYVPWINNDAIQDCIGFCQLAIQKQVPLEQIKPFIEDQFAEKYIII
jgi:hypothetical protein